MRERAELVEKNNPKISVRMQCELLGVARSTVDYVPVPEDPQDVLIKRLLDEIYLKDPCLGTRRLVTILARDYGIVVNRKRLRRLREEMGVETIWCRPRTSIPDDGHRKYPYLLRNLAITRPDQVWCADITGWGAEGWFWGGWRCGLAMRWAFRQARSPPSKTARMASSDPPSRLTGPGEALAERAAERMRGTCGGGQREARSTKF